MAILFMKLPEVQNFLGNTVASIVSNKLGTKVFINKIDLGLFNRIIIDGILIYDKNGREMLKTAKMTARFELIPLVNGKISLSSVQIFGAHFVAYKSDSQTDANYQFVLDSLASKGNSKQSPIDFRINSLIMRNCSFSYDRYDIAPTPRKLNTSHLKLTDISAHIIIKTFSNDSINANIRRIAFNEQSGLNVKKLSFKIMAGTRNLLVHGLRLEMFKTRIAFGDVVASYRINDKKPLYSSLVYYGSVVNSKIDLSELSCFAPKLKHIKSNIVVSAVFCGTANRLKINNVFVRSQERDLRIIANGQAENLTSSPSWNLNIKNMGISCGKLLFTIDPFVKCSPQVRTILEKAGNIVFSGNMGSSVNKGFACSCKINTDIGRGKINFAFGDRSKIFKSIIKVQDVDLYSILDDERFGKISANFDISGILYDHKDPTVSVDGKILSVGIKNYNYRNIEIAGKYDNSGIAGTLSINDPNAVLKLSGIYGINSKRGKKINIVADIFHFKPEIVKLTNQWGNADFSFSINAEMTANNFNDAVGNIKINDFALKSPEGSFRINSTNVEAGFKDSMHYFSLKNDYANAELLGHFDYRSLINSFTNFIGDNVPTFKDVSKTTVLGNNNFSFNASITNTVWLSKLLGIPLKSSGPISIYTKFDDKNRDLYLNCTFDNIQYSRFKFKKGCLTFSSSHKSLLCNLTGVYVMESGNEINITGSCDACQNNLSTSISWDSNSDSKFSGEFNSTTQFYKDDNGIQMALINILPSHIAIKDNIWNVMPSNIVYSANTIDIKDFAIKHDDQYIALNGKISEDEKDTLIVDLKRVDVGYVLDLVDFHSVDFDGAATGRVYVKAPLGKTSISSDMVIDKFLFQDGRMGTLLANVNWKKAEGQINIHATSNDGPDAMTYINGYVSLVRNYIDLNIHAAGTHIDFLESFTNSFMDNINGHAIGFINVVGPLKKINLVGRLVVNGETTILPTNCTYYLRNDTINFITNEIKLTDVSIFDKYYNKGILSCSIHHKYLKDLSYDLHVNTNKLLGYDIKEIDDNNFCGTIYASGNVDIHGSQGRTNIDISITPQENSTFIYDVSSRSSTINQNFIKWHDVTSGYNNTTRQSQSSISSSEIHQDDAQSDLYINLLLNCTPDVTIKLLMDSRTNDYIILNGVGTLRATDYNKGGFSMYGTYIIQNGTYGITIQDLIKKSFVFKDGSSITFRGDPNLAELNLQTVHTINSVSLSDLNVGNSFTNNSIRVNCLMNISGQPQKPTITFDLDLPTVSSDEMQLIKSVINSEDEMNQQVLYLLGIGRFYPQRQNNATSQNAGQPNQTSLAMQGILSGTVSTQINNVLNSVVNSDNWNFGANISTGDEGWNNAEYEGVLSGHLLNNRLLINGQFGYKDNANSANTNFIGDFDIRYLLKPNGNLSIKVYNQTNDRYFTNSSLNTQGIGVIMKKDFTSFKDLFKKSGGK